MSDLLDEVLGQSRAFGFLGPGPITEQRSHAEAFLTAIEGTPRSVIDLGSGGGVPGLVLALLLPASSWTLLDAMQRRTAFLVDAVDLLGLGDRVRVVTERAETAGRGPSLRNQADLVVARGFGSPAVTAECAAPLLQLGGQLVVSEPPDAVGERWPASGLARLGLVRERSISGPPAFVRLRKVAATDDRYPRRDGRPRKQPLW